MDSGLDSHFLTDPCELAGTKSTGHKLTRFCTRFYFPQMSLQSNLHLDWSSVRVAGASYFLLEVLHFRYLGIDILYSYLQYSTR